MKSSEELPNLTDKELETLKYRLEKSIERTVEDFEHETGKTIDFNNLEYCTWSRIKIDIKKY